MSANIDPKLRSIIETLRTQGFTLKGIPNGFRVKLEEGHDVDVYTLKSNPSHVRARIRTSIRDEDERKSLVDEVNRRLSISMESVADLKSFRLIKEAEGVFFYYAHVDMSASPEFYDSVSVGSGGGGGAGGEEGIEVTEVFVEEEAAAAPGEEEGTGAHDAGSGEGLQEEAFLADGAEESGKPPAAETAVFYLEDVDAKMLRKAMDALRLPRSSNVRLVLTRLYRSAVDPGELGEAVKVEAAKIRESDMDELRMVRKQRAIDFLNPLVDLLWNAVSGGSGSS